MRLETEEERRLWRDYVIAIGPGAECLVETMCTVADRVVQEYRERTRPSSVDLLLARVLRYRWDPLLPETAAAIRERLHDATDDDLAEIIQTGRWPIPDGGPTDSDLRGEVEAAWEWLEASAGREWASADEVAADAGPTHADLRGEVE